MVSVGCDAEMPEVASHAFVACVGEQESHPLVSDASEGMHLKQRFLSGVTVSMIGVSMT